MTKPGNIVEINLQPGDFYFGDRTTRIRTLLGSCIAITLWHPQRCIGGMCHYMLPSRPIRYGPLQGKYADEAMELFIQQARSHKTQLKDYQIKVFGGGHMFPEYALRHSTSVCEKNIAAAQRLLAYYQLTPLSQDVGLTGHRNIVFEIWNGNVWVRYQPQMKMKSNP